MKSWSRQARLGVIAAASFVLLITVLPQLASGLGLASLANRLESSTTCSSSSGKAAAPFSSSGSSSQCTPPAGALHGTITVTGAPKGFTPAYTGVGACPAATASPSSQLCPDPTYTLTSDGTYTLSLAPGVWRVDAFYEDNAFGGAFLGKAQNVTIPSGKTVKRDLTVPYSKPAILKGTITVTGVPARDTIDEFNVLLCPSYAPYNGTSSSIACVSGYGDTGTSTDSATYKIDGLPPGSWTVYPGYCTEYGCETNADVGKSVTLTGGATTTADVTTPFITPGNGLLSATVTVTGEPAGVSETTLLQACQGSNCQTYYGYGEPGGTLDLLLADGTWTINSFYLAQPFDNAVAGPSKTVKIKGGVTTTLSLSVPYQAPGTATGSIVVAGVPLKVTVNSYTVLACPIADKWTPGTVPSIACASEYSGPGGYGYGAADRNEIKNVFAPAGTRPPAGFKGPAQTPDNTYQVTTLTPGKWILYPGYGTDFGSYVDSSGTTVSVTANKTTNKLLTAPYQAPTDGAVTGTVTVIGAPANDFSSGVQACSAKPADGVCQGEQQSYNESTDQYTITLAPGNWWLAGFVQDSSGESTSAYTEIAVKAGVESDVDFTVTAGS
jgi:hypothetical protein